MIDEWSPDRTGFARFSGDRAGRYRLARALTAKGFECRRITANEAGVDVAELRKHYAVVAFVMLNPSTADAFKVDPTVAKCCKIARNNGADVLEVVNLFSFRSTYPADLYMQPYEKGLPIEAWRERVGASETNDREILAACAGARVIVAWGTHGRLGGRDAEVAAQLARAGIEMWALGTNQDGSPIHPLARGHRAVKLDVVLQKWSP